MAVTDLFKWVLYLFLHEKSEEERTVAGFLEPVTFKDVAVEFTQEDRVMLLCSEK
jgi:hypothetical protein